MQRELPEGWNKFKLGELTRIRTGKLDVNAQDINGKYPFFTCSQKVYSIDFYDYDCECVLVAGNGDLNVKYYNGKFNAYQRTYIIESLDQRILDVKYLYYFLNKYISILRNKSIGGVIKYIKLGYLKDIKIPIPKLEIQKKIVYILEKSEDTKRLRAQADELTQQLLQSLFLEMFGDPANNPNGFDQVKLGDIGDVSSGLTLNGQRRNNKQNLYPYLRVANVFRNKFNLSEIKYIHVSNSELDRFLLKKNDVLIVEGHGNIEEIGRSAVWNGQISNCVHQNHIIKVRLNEKYISPFFVSYFLNMYGNNGYFSSKSRTTSGLNTISTNKVKNTKVCLPPIGLQKKFERIVVNMKQIQDIQKPSKQHIENLFNSLVQKAFKGELIK
ncbi:restriction endonuclease subunit S [Methanohalophilus portucalensis]|uniref:Restriction endonuclease S subunits-like protein n=2 Tax=Methanohalophilus portucalensis TaxID=39664 RepID=A0A1L9C6E6_9EURY|nr:restriction endonuclease subunit S [Methanohalophilus portucalensis]ATU08596.1 hypothetical protein BKM01_07310 [Methanohalophilus portucalensis]OJH49968.1 restriction endonuclease S subunits-like protein [Methanohalophilus portucalensis FDF-1]RNI13230.1 hypothetical protein EFE41_01195 [Methanohalophilus portucalensis FDF-1]SMH32488.1 type I restriction enzyme, S subunit [Methanohalophilus portucalensis FDF-1]